MKKGLVIKAIAGFFYVYADGEVHECKSSTKLKKNKQQILPGDNVLFEEENNYIKEILPRENELIRPKIANVLGAILVFSLVEPKMNFGLLDRMLMIMEHNNLKPIILMTKKDICPDDIYEDVSNKMKYYENIGYEVLYNDKINTKEELIDHLKYDKYILTGQSGVGKSTFLNKIVEGANAKTNEISQVLGRGKHTTRETIFYTLDKDKYLIDTPGFSALDIDLSREDIRDEFKDFVELSSGCKFNGCYHINEPDCAVKNAYENGEILKSRYDNYKKLVEDVK